MTPQEYVEAAIRTKSNKFHFPFNSRDMTVKSELSIDVLHAIIGISTEAGELLDAAKKYLFYAKDIDYVNLDEEIGDILWYIAIYCNARNITIESLMQQNIAKLMERYPEKFTSEKAINRNLDKEREVLESQPADWSRMEGRFRPGS